MSINKVILVGNVGKDPVVRYFDKGVAKATFPLATSDTYTNKQGETVTTTEWHNIVLWRALAEVAEKTVKKGSQVYIVGSIKTRSYVDKDGVNKYITEILADTMFTLEKKQPSGSGSWENSRSVNQKQAQPDSANEPAGNYSPANDDITYKSGDEFSARNQQEEDDLPF